MADPTCYVHFFCLDTSQTNQRKSQNPIGQFHLTPYIPITIGTGVYLLSDSPEANDIMELRSIGQV
ncbi:MAG: hypothetical protein J7K51_03790 [Thermotogae bacterium]|nr:hypothetical protein [Thermotogota bacterium]